VKPTALVVTTVHWPDDTRIRERLIRTLSDAFEVDYASREPGPTDRSGLCWIPLSGGRFRRWWKTLGVCLRTDWDVLAIHDPELIPIGMVARLVKRRRVVFDVHEDVPATALTREWVPDLLRTPLATAARVAMRLAERTLEVTLAEAGYRYLFRQEHPVFPNYPDTSAYPDPTDGEASIVYLGDVTVERGAVTAVSASRKAGLPLTLVGRSSDGLREYLRDLSGEQVKWAGPLPNPKALELIRHAGVGISPLHDSPNYRESTPTKILEYLALGLPVVASDLPGTRRLVDGLDAVELVPPEDVDGLARAIERALDPSVRARATAQVPRIRERFVWPNDDVVRFYASLV
jgi:glycosyltransferase involved in cell wall biosynthesis